MYKSWWLFPHIPKTLEASDYIATVLVLSFQLQKYIASVIKYI
jgi:hypothetical protein